MKAQHVLLMLAMISAFSCSERKSSSNKLEAFADSLIHPLIDSGKIAGAVVGVYKKSEEMLLKGYGYADLEWSVPSSSTAIFPIASVTKQFTAVAVLHLAEQGKLNINDDINKYIQFDTKEQKVTVRDLLSHTSGIKSYTEMEFMENLRQFRFRRDTLLRIVEKEPFNFPPRSMLMYNNTGYFMLGLLIEKISGKTYAEYMREEIFPKAGMVNSSYCSADSITRNRAHGYDYSEAGLVISPVNSYHWPFSAGALCSTADDLAKWNDALHNGRVLGVEMYKEFISPTTLINGRQTRYAKGIMVGKKHGKKMYTHPGDIQGYSCENRYFPDEQMTIVILTNTNGVVAPGSICSKFGDHIFGATGPDKLFTGSLAPFTGTYSGPARAGRIDVNVTANNHALVVQYRDLPPRALQFADDSTWTDGNINFRFKGSGNIVHEMALDVGYGYYFLERQ
jgi:CubicO group peptidase (beta-lactamase class C family)